MVSRSSLTRCDPKNLHLGILSVKVGKAFLHAAELKFLPCGKWYAAGGTALALQVGHRLSVDLDFFSPERKVNLTSLERQFFNTGHWSTSFRDGGTLYGRFWGAKMSFISYPFFRPAHPKVKCGRICILAPQDIAAMKIIAVSQRGRKRDFVDLYWYCLNREPLAGVIRRAIRQYPGQEHNLHHFLKSLVYFEDAENDPMPRLFFQATWNGVKKYFRREVPRAARDLLNL